MICIPRLVRIMLPIKYTCARTLRTSNSLRSLDILCWIRVSQVSSIVDRFEASIGIGGSSVDSLIVMIRRKIWK
jgi:hypothetical protein